MAIIITALTDNKNRTVGEIRHILGKWNGNLAAENSVAWMFSRKGQVVVEKSKADEDKLLNVALDAGADDMNDDGSAWEIVSAPEAFEAVRDAVKKLGIEPAAAEIAMIPQNYVKLEGKEAQQVLRMRTVKAVASGMSQVEAARVFGVTRQAVGKWMRAHAAGGVRALKAQRRGRPKGSGGRLKPWQAAHTAKLLTDRTPDQLKLPFYLWTRVAVAELIERKFGIRLSLSSVGRYLARWVHSAEAGAPCLRARSTGR